jgi:Flp pilus assembly protein TadG
MTFEALQVRRSGQEHSGSTSGAPGATVETAVARLPLRDLIARYRRAEDGALMVFSLFIIVIMLLVVGIAVDMTRFESRRATLQSTLDRSVLAAADLDQRLDPAAVVRDYFRKANLENFLVGDPVVVRENDGLNLRRVSASAQMGMPTLFMHLGGVEELRAPAAGTAEEWVTNVEISMVLDISGSMRWYDRISDLRSAAKLFVDLVLQGDAREVTSINIVPYAGMVNPGERFFNYVGAVRTHNHSSCIELTAADFTHAGLPGTGRAQVPHFMQWPIDLATMSWGWCPDPATGMVVGQNDPGDLHAYIDGIRLNDGTGTHVGMKYGLMLLNPAMNDYFRGLADDGLIDRDFDNRPVAWNVSGSERSVRKYIVLMTDGQITDQFRPRFTGFRDIDHDTIDNERVNGVEDPDKIDGIDHDLWNATVELERQPAGNRTAPLTTRATNLTRFYDQCNLARANGVTVFAIAFRAPANAQTEMRNCATSPATYFNVTTTNQGELAEVFSAIARTINRLRLTQ